MHYGAIMKAQKPIKLRATSHMYNNTFLKHEQPGAQSCVSQILGDNNWNFGKSKCAQTNTRNVNNATGLR